MQIVAAELHLDAVGRGIEPERGRGERIDVGRDHAGSTGQAARRWRPGPSRWRNRARSCRATSSGWSRTWRANPCPPAQAKAQKGGGRPISASSSSVRCQSSCASPARWSRISGTCGGAASEVLARMKARWSGTADSSFFRRKARRLIGWRCGKVGPRHFARRRHQPAHAADFLPLVGRHRLHRKPPEPDQRHLLQLRVRLDRLRASAAFGTSLTARMSTQSQRSSSVVVS